MRKSLLIGTILGALTVTAIYSSMSNNSVKRLKRSFIRKLEDTIM